MYPQKLIKSLGISDQKLPRVEDAGKRVGTINKKIAADIGITDTAAIILSKADRTNVDPWILYCIDHIHIYKSGTFEHCPCHILSGMHSFQTKKDSSGTVTVFRTLSKKNSITPSPKIYDIPFYLENARIVGGSNNLSDLINFCGYIFSFKR